MATKYYIGDFVECLSSDTKPTGFDSGARCLETDTLKEFFWNGSTWTPYYSSVIASGYQTVYRENSYVSGNILSGVAQLIPNGRIYNTGANDLQVFVNGFIQCKNSAANNPNADYWEASNTGIYFSYAIPTGSVISYQILVK